jgi:hypothetical protein
MGVLKNEGQSGRSSVNKPKIIRPHTMQSHLVQTRALFERRKPLFLVFPFSNLQGAVHEG